MSSNRRILYRNTKNSFTFFLFGISEALQEERELRDPLTLHLAVLQLGDMAECVQAHSQSLTAVEEAESERSFAAFSSVNAV